MMIALGTDAEEAALEGIGVSAAEGVEDMEVVLEEGLPEAVLVAVLLREAGLVAVEEEVGDLEGVALAKGVGSEVVVE